MNDLQFILSDDDTRLPFLPTVCFRLNLLRLMPCRARYALYTIWAQSIIANQDNVCSICKPAALHAIQLNKLAAVQSGTRQYNGSSQAVR